MIKKILSTVLLFMLVAVADVNAQENVLNFGKYCQWLIDTEVTFLERDVRTTIKNTPELKQYDSLNIYYILLMNHDGTMLIDRDYIDYSMLRHLQHSYFDKRTKKLFSKSKKYIVADAIITDSLGNYLGYYYLGHIYLNRVELYYQITQMFHDNEIDYAFRIPYPFPGDIICIKNNEIFAFGRIVKEKDFKSYSWNQLLEKMGVNVVNHQ